MSDSSSSSSSPKDLNNLLSNKPAPVASPSVQEVATPAAPAGTSTSTSTTPAPAVPTTTSTAPSIREDMIKPAVSFLSSPNVRSADKAKKIAFLQNKGMNQAEIDEAFKRAGDSGSTVSSTPTTTTPTSTNPSLNHVSTYRELYYKYLNDHVNFFC
jgi:hypothetical protein